MSDATAMIVASLILTFGSLGIVGFLIWLKARDAEERHHVRKEMEHV